MAEVTFSVRGTPRQFVCTLDEPAPDGARTLQAGLGTTQMAHARYTVAEVQRRKLPIRVAVIALETEMTESALLMYANGNNPASLQLPHDAVGWDHGSVGLYQQQVGGAVNSTANWGTTAELMNVAISTDKFLNALARINWASLTNWDAAQRVQGSFDPSGGNYKRNDASATALANQLWTQPPTGFLMALTDQQQKDLYGRIMGGLGQRWYTQDAAGHVHPCSATTPGAIPAHPLDTLDGAYLAGQIAALAAKVDALTLKGTP